VIGIVAPPANAAASAVNSDPATKSPAVFATGSYLPLKDLSGAWIATDTVTNCAFPVMPIRMSLVVLPISVALPLNIIPLMLASLFAVFTFCFC
jgi:hypothetical protein